MPALLTHVETPAAALGVERLNVQVPGLNAAAVHHLLGRGFRIDPWINLLMSNKPCGQFDRFIAISPVFLSPVVVGRRASTCAATLSRDEQPTITGTAQA